DRHPAKAIRNTALDDARSNRHTCHEVRDPRGNCAVGQCGRARAYNIAVPQDQSGNNYPTASEDLASNVQYEASLVRIEGWVLSKALKPDGLGRYLKLAHAGTADKDQLARGRFVDDCLQLGCRIGAVGSHGVRKCWSGKDKADEYDDRLLKPFRCNPRKYAHL